SAATRGAFPASSRLREMLQAILANRPRKLPGKVHPGAYAAGSPVWPCVIVAVFTGWLLFDHLGERDLWGSHEARAAQNAQRFLTDGGWGLLRLYDDQPELQKPPLYYWLVALAAWLRGVTVDAWAARMPAAPAGL